MRFRVFAALLASSGFVAAQTAPALEETLTVEQAADVALKNNRQVRAALLEVEKFEARLAAVRTRRLPSFGLQSMGGTPLTPVRFRFPSGSFGNFASTGPIPTSDIEIGTGRGEAAFIMLVQANQPLTPLYNIGLNLRQVRNSRELAREEVRSKRQEIVNAVRQAYYAAVVTESALLKARQDIRTLREIDRITGEYVVQRVALKSDSLVIKTRLAKSEYEELQLSGALDSRKEQLNVLLGRDPAQPLRLVAPTSLAGYEIELAAAEHSALEQRPEVRLARQRLALAQDSIQLKRSEAIPEVGLALTYIGSNLQILPHNILMAGFSVRWEPFDWGRRRHEIAEARLSKQQAELALREAENMVRLETRAKYRKLQESRQLLRVAQLGQQASEESLRVVKDRYSQNAALQKDLLQAQDGTTEASHQYREALLAFWTARADLEKALGEDQ